MSKPTTNAADLVTNAIEVHNHDTWYMDLLDAAIDESDTVENAILIANQAYKDNPTPPVANEEEEEDMEEEENTEVEEEPAVDEEELESVDIEEEPMEGEEPEVSEEDMEEEEPEEEMEEEEQEVTNSLDDVINKASRVRFIRIEE